MAKQLFTVAIPCFIGSCHVGVSRRNVFHLASVLDPIVCPYTFFWLIRSLVDPTSAAFTNTGI